MSNLRYRPEIDGLRALAVIGVVLYHIGLGFPGGYVGVDVFFVISGYLITGIIAKDLRNGTFSMLDFWVRRIRRILPAVTVTIVASLILGYFILDAGQFKDLAKSSMAQSLMAANVFFWLDNMSYFAEASDMKPLLHTWSLAVEEQFYVVFPLALSLLSKHLRKYTLPVIIFVGIVSLVLSCWAQVHKPGANFFLLPTRAWELLAGAVIALMANQKEISRKATELAAWLGLLMIAAAMLFYNAETPFPGWAAIPPVAGSAIFIWANGRQQTSAGQLLSFRPVVFIGLISYSFYLWHWPLLVFVKYVIIDVSLSYKMGILAGSLIISIASWKWVETPFRRNTFLSKRSSAFGFAALSTIGLLLMSATIWKMNGVPGRFNDNFDLLREDISWVGKEYKSELGSYVMMGAGSSVDDRREVEPSFALWGDSHALVVMETVDVCAQKNGLKGYAYLEGGRIPVTGLVTVYRPDNVEYSEAVVDSIINNGVKHLILIARWSYYIQNDQDDQKNLANKAELRRGLMEVGDVEAVITPARSGDLLIKHLKMMIQKLKSHGVTVWLIKQVPESSNDHVARDFYMGKKLPVFNHLPQQYTIFKSDHEKKQAHANTAIDSVPHGLIRVVDPAPHFFRDSDQLKVYGEGAYYRDRDHLTRAGADYYLSGMFDGIFAEIAEQQKDSLKGE